nr:reverse transcriptase domain-containing protein [Tanacetum cinerariifolium]
MDQMLKRLAGNEYYCFLDGFFGYFQTPINPRNQEKTTFTCPYKMFAYRRMPFGLCNASGTFQRCMLAMFHDMVEKMMEIFMDDFSVFRNSFENYLSCLDKMLQSVVATFKEHEQQENEFSKEKYEAKPPIFIDTVNNNGDNDSRTSGSETPAKEVVDNGIESEVVVGLPGEFQEGDMVDALSIVEQKSLGNWKELDNKVFVSPRMSLAATYQKEVVTEWPEQFQEG